MTNTQVRHGTFWFIPPVVFCLAVTTLDRKTDRQTDVQHPQSSASEQTPVSELNYSAADSGKPARNKWNKQRRVFDGCIFYL